MFNTRDSEENADIKARIDEILEEMVQQEKIKFNCKSVHYFRSKTAETGDVMRAVLYIVTKQ